MGSGFFPLDKELGLLPGSLSPSLQENLVRLSTHVPFGVAVELLKHFNQVSLSRETARRSCEKAGRAYGTIQTEQVKQIEQTLPPVTPPQEPQIMSVDGVMVPLVKGEWAEVKNLVIGAVGREKNQKGVEEIKSHSLSYFSRLTGAEQFGNLALVETQRRGVSENPAVVAVVDGAEWIQSFIDFHCPQAVRILDFPHAAERIAQIGTAVFKEKSQSWLEEQLHKLKHEGITPVLEELNRLRETHPQSEVLEEHLKYLKKRESQAHYPEYIEEGWPIGSGIVESGNKVVVEARLKGAGMHWERGNVNPMLGLRNMECNGRWEEGWGNIVVFGREALKKRRAERALHKKEAEKKETSEPVEINPEEKNSEENLKPTGVEKEGQKKKEEVRGSTVKEPWKPPATHPWRHPFRTPKNGEDAIAS